MKTSTVKEYSRVGRRLVNLTDSTEDRIFEDVWPSINKAKKHSRQLQAQGHIVRVCKS